MGKIRPAKEYTAHKEIPLLAPGGSPGSIGGFMDFTGRVGWITCGYIAFS